MWVLTSTCPGVSYMRRRFCFALTVSPFAVNSEPCNCVEQLEKKHKHHTHYGKRETHNSFPLKLFIIDIHIQATRSVCIVLAYELIRPLDLRAAAVNSLYNPSRGTAMCIHMYMTVLGRGRAGVVGREALHKQAGEL